ncbi:carbohydrate sulfotransferase 11-like isoform X2 [Mytilus californianus]|uniref:carbohydrate sulfotransferase 11-like isoform X2 n=1 Tax=Mytilus californianus TaxID=6549 RepID=UPI002246556B|nr:carbohydrate sulfotransferase 11-like isoform X2 [Mytilus californianus]
MKRKSTLLMRKILKLKTSRIVTVFVCYLVLMLTNNLYKEDRSIKVELDKGDNIEISKKLSMQDTSQDHNIDTIMKSRKQNLDKQCYNRIDVGRSDENNFKAHMQFVPDDKMVYCGIEKVGSTFWRRLIQLLYKREIRSPYSIKPWDCMNNYKSFQSQKLDDYHYILKENSKFLFVRDPYSRLLSGYLDKIFSPNPYYWNLIGSKAVAFTRKQKNHCGHDVTFPEMVEYFIHTEEQNKDRDGHFLPATDNCRPCLVHYDYIGKMETFTDDVFFILKEFNLENYTSALNDFQTDSILDAISDTVQTFRDVRIMVTRCLSVYGGLKRIWRKLQIRGIIAEQIQFPFTSKDLTKLRPTTFKNAIINAYIESKDKYNMKDQKRKYLISAYNLIPIATMNKLQKIFQNDFQIFGYDKRPDYLYQPRQKNLADIFKL